LDEKEAKKGTGRGPGGHIKKKVPEGRTILMGGQPWPNRLGKKKQSQLTEDPATKDRQCELKMFQTEKKTKERASLTPGIPLAKKNLNNPRGE